MVGSRIAQGIHVKEKFSQRSRLHFSDSFDSVIVINRYGFAEVNSRFRVEFVDRIVHEDPERIFIHSRLPRKSCGRCSLAVNNGMGILVYAKFGRCLARIGRDWA